jgi:uncharacterized protein (UPF0332 family)
MPFNPEQWLKVADVCCIHIPEVNEEALLRTAVNRAYYAALLSLKRRIESVQGRGSVPTSGTHQALSQALRILGGDFSDVAEELGRLREARNKADYHLDTDPLVRKTVVEHIRRSRTLILNRINAIRDDEYRRLRIARS